MQAHAYTAFIQYMYICCAQYVCQLYILFEWHPRMYCTRTQDVVIHFTCIKPNNNKFKRCLVNYGCACAEIYAASDLKLEDWPHMYAFVFF